MENRMGFRWEIHSAIRWVIGWETLMETRWEIHWVNRMDSG
jgi:hypothetical protein